MKRGIIYAAVATVGLLTLWWVMRGHDKRVDQSITAPRLGVEDRAKIVLDVAHHTVTQIVRQPGGGEKVTRTFLNTHGPVAVVEKKDGRTVLIQRTWGTELSPFAGGALGSDFKFRIALGVNGFYVQRWELGGGLLLNAGNVKDIRAFAHIGYNVYGNWILSAGVDHRKEIHAIASVRF